MGLLCSQFGRSLLVLIGILGVVFSCLSAASCNFVDTGRSIPGRTGSMLLDVEDRAGIFIYQTDADQTCDLYGDYLDSDPIIAGVRVASVLAPMFAVLALIVQITELIFCTMCCVENVICFGYFVAYACQASTFSMFASNVW